MKHTLEDVKAAVKAAVDRKPHNRNPYSHAEGSCLNTGKRGNHCIAAQVLVDLGYEVPGYNDEHVAVGIRSLCWVKEIVDDFESAALDYLEDVQGEFDMPTDYGRSDRRQWRTAYNRFLKESA